VTPPHPVRLVVEDDLRRNRLTVFFRLLLALPHLVWVYLWGWTAFGGVVIFNWFATLFAGRSEEDVQSFLGRYIRYNTHLRAYLLLVANPYPRFAGRAGTYPIDLELDPPERQNRLTVLFRLILVLPALVLATVLNAVATFVALVGWFIALVVGRTPKGMRDLMAYCLRYEAQTYAYLFLVTGRYPSLASGSGFQFEEG
jgi:hypothetical protein